MGNEASRIRNKSLKDRSILEPNESTNLKNKDRPQMRWGMKPQGWEKNHREIGAPHNQMSRKASGMRTKNRQLWEWNTTSRMETNACENGEWILQRSKNLRTEWIRKPQEWVHMTDALGMNPRAGNETKIGRKLRPKWIREPRPEWNWDWKEIETGRR